MSRLALGPSLRLSLIALLLTGCSRPTLPPGNGATDVETPTKRADPVKLAAELLHQPAEVGQVKEALNLLGPYLDRPDVRERLALAAPARAFLVQTVKLEPADLAEVESYGFRTPDAYHVEECLLLRAVARTLEVGDPVERPRLAFDWVMRNVLFHEQRDQGLPVGFVLKRGYGSAADRARVVLALLRQMPGPDGKPHEGCVFVLPGAATTPALIGMLEPDGKSPRLFDPRLGEPIRKGAAIATLADVRQDPTLLAASGLSAEQVKTLRPLLALPLDALAPRLAELEKLLAAQDAVALHIDPIALERSIRAAVGTPATVWGDSVRALRRFLPSEEGGVDTTQRLRLFPTQLAPLASAALEMDRMRLTQQYLAEPAFRHLFEQYVGVLFERYHVQPHEFLLRGERQRLHERLDRIRPWLDDDSLAALRESAAFAKELAEWREKANVAYTALVRKEPRAQEKINALWSEDQYMNALRQADAERIDERPETRPKKAVLTRIVAVACREPLLRQADWLEAASWQERAARAAAAAATPGAGARATHAAGQAWLNTRGFWRRYLSRPAASGSALTLRLVPVRHLIKAGQPRELEIALNLLEDLYLEFDRSCRAKLHLAEAARHVEGAAAARTILKSAAAELKAQREGGPLRQSLVDLQGALAVAGRKDLLRRAELLAHNGAPDGGFTWLGRAYEARLARLK